MRITQKELKDAFYAECSRASNLSLGRAFFNLRDVTLFLNSAYMSCVNRRLGLIDPRFLPAEKRALGQGANNQTPDSMRVLLDFGTLYKVEYLNPFADGWYAPSGLPLETIGGERAILFNFHAFGGASETPYILNASLVELDAKNAKKRLASYLCKPMGISDAPKFALMYQENKYLPYIYYRLRPVVVETSPATSKAAAVRGAYMAIELNAPASRNDKFAKPNYRLHVDYIQFPPKLDMAILADDAQASAQILPVMFGFEIAMEAAKIAMETLGNQRSGTLDKTISDQIGA